MTLTDLELEFDLDRSLVYKEIFFRPCKIVFD